MGYRDYDGLIEDAILEQLKKIEEKEKVRILYAAESGSRAWGIASPDSDYDVRFIYVRPLEYYLGLQVRRDYIGWTLDETLDINGWDLAKVLRHIHKSNVTMFEWAYSPLVYQTTPEWAGIQKEILQYYSNKAAMYQYYGTAKKNYWEHLNDIRLKYKKYFYVLRPILACKWIEEKACPPPMQFQELADAVLEEDMKPIVAELLEKKRQMNESEKGERIDPLNRFLQKNLDYYKQKVEEIEEDKTENWDKINKMFLDALYYGDNDKKCTGQQCLPENLTKNKASKGLQKKGYYANIAIGTK